MLRIEISPSYVLAQRRYDRQDDSALLDQAEEEARLREAFIASEKAKYISACHAGEIDEWIDFRTHDDMRELIAINRMESAGAAQARYNALIDSIIERAATATAEAMADRKIFRR